MPDKLRRDPKVLELLCEFDAKRKLIAAICHGGWMPISAGIYRGVKVTGSPGIKDDLINAGAAWFDSAHASQGIDATTEVDTSSVPAAIRSFVRRRAVESFMGLRGTMRARVAPGQETGQRPRQSGSSCNCIAP